MSGLKDTWLKPLGVRHIMRLLLPASIFLLQACATSGELTTARAQFSQGNTNLALQTLNQAEVSRRDELLLLLDKALVAQAAGKYEQSITTFEEAYQLIDKLDYVSARDQSAALVSNDWAIRYSGEYSERLWIHTFQMINYLMLERPDGAAVEARRALALYQDHNDVLDSDLFTRYLMAMSFEKAGQQDSAQVEYRKLSDKLGDTTHWTPVKHGKELVLLVATGFIAPKLPGDLIVDLNARISFPFYPDVNTTAPEIDVRIDAVALEPLRVDTRLVSVAINALAKRSKAIAARHALRLATKYSLAHSIEDQDPLAGSIAKLFLLLIEQADTRSWETLPAYLSLVRVIVPEDTATVSVRIDSSGRDSSGVQGHTLNLALTDDVTQFRMIRIGAQNNNQLVASP